MLGSVLGLAANVLGSIDLTQVDFSAMVTMIEAAVPSVLTAIIPIVGVRKVIGFIIGSVKGA